jgi:hypothetical protein
MFPEEFVIYNITKFVHIFEWAVKGRYIIIIIFYSDEVEKATET